ncbi:hypothetical protein, partial [Escherichia coli]
ADRNRSHWSTSKTPSYTKSVSWQHHPKLRISLPVWSQPGYELQLLQIKKLSWKASRNEEDCRVLTVKSNRRISGKPERFR